MRPRHVGNKFLISKLGTLISETQYQRHAKELAITVALSQFDGIVCVSGDGVLVEVLNGLLERPDWERAIKMPIGIIPAGTVFAAKLGLPPFRLLCF